MSKRQPASSSNADANSVWIAVLRTQRFIVVSIPDCAGRLMRHLRNRHRLQALHKSLRINQVELGIGCFHAQKELVSGHSGETIHVEQWVIRHGQTIQSEHSKNTGESREEN